MWVATNNTGETVAIRDESGKHLVEDGTTLTDISKSVAMQCRSRGFDVDFLQSTRVDEPEPEPAPAPVEEEDEKPKRKATVRVSED